MWSFTKRTVRYFVPRWASGTLLVMGGFFFGTNYTLAHGHFVAASLIQLVIESIKG